MFSHNYHVKFCASAEARRLLKEAYGDHAPSTTMCQDWFKRFRNGNFPVDDKERCGGFENAELEVLLDEDDTKTQDQLAEALNTSRQFISKRLHAMGKIQKDGKWVPHETYGKPGETLRKFCSRSMIENDFSIESSPEIRSGYTSRILNAEHHGLSRGQIVSAKRQ